MSAGRTRKETTRVAAVKIIEDDLSESTANNSPQQRTDFDGKSVGIGDTIVFTVHTTGNKEELVKVVLGGVEARKLFKVVADSHRLYQILPSLEIWIGTNRSRHIGVAYLADPQRLLLLGPSDHNHYRSQGAAAERTVVKVEVLSEDM